MSRKRANWTDAGEKLFDALAQKGLPAGEIAKRLGAIGEAGASRATVGRRLAERVGARRSGRAGNVDATPRAKAVPPPPPTPTPAPVASTNPADVLAETEPDAAATLEEINMWLERVNRAYMIAEESGNTAAIVALAGRAAALVDTRRKAAPPPPADPNAFPDLVDAAARAKTLLAKKLEAAQKRGRA
jgi:hypothetical protein